MVEMGLRTAWCRANRSPVIVAVIDDGVDYKHPDLAANIYRNPLEIENNSLDDDSNGIVDDFYGARFLVQELSEFPKGAGDPMPRQGQSHGTACASIIGAVGDNNLGMTGVCWSVQLLPINVFHNNGATAFDQIRAIDYAVDQGAKVISMSLGGYTYPERGRAEALQRAEEAGVLVVAAAGNEKNDNDDNLPHDVVQKGELITGVVFGATPASYDLNNIISVAAMKADFSAMAPFSNFGFRTVDIAAAGEEVRAAKPGGGFVDDFNGTSAACPHVAGAAALILGLPEYASMTPAEVRNILLQNSKPVATLKGKVNCGGMLDLSFICRQPTDPCSRSTGTICGQH